MLFTGNQFRICRIFRLLTARIGGFISIDVDIEFDINNDENLKR